MMNMASRSRRFVPALLFPLLVVASACSGIEDSVDSTESPPFEPEVDSVEDNFQFQATGVTNATWTFSYGWFNSGMSANVTQAATITAGTATVTVFDTSRPVYSKSLSVEGTFPTAVGNTGFWSVDIVFTNYSGTVNVRVEGT